MKSHRETAERIVEVACKAFDAERLPTLQRENLIADLLPVLKEGAGDLDVIEVQNVIARLTESIGQVSILLDELELELEGVLDEGV